MSNKEKVDLFLSFFFFNSIYTFIQVQTIDAVSNIIFSIISIFVRLKVKTAPFVSINLSLANIFNIVFFIVSNLNMGSHQSSPNC